MRNLVIVESPAKAKTIEKYLGKDFTVLSSVGHIRKDTNVDPQKDFKITFEIDPGHIKIVSDLKKAAKSADKVWLATDEDREGEAISWHLAEVLGLPKTTPRITFHEITKSALEEAIQKPGRIDMKMVESQQARQSLDMLVGYDLSGVVRRKVPGAISAGRVQSPALRLIVEREREIAAFSSQSEFKVSGKFFAHSEEFNAALDHSFSSEAHAENFLKSLRGAEYSVSDVETNPATKNSPAPFTTASLQIEANQKLGFTTRTTMSAAQGLYQSGHITYHRTDSLNLSGQALSSIGKFVKKEYGEKYHQVRNFRTKDSNAQEAHEAIRPSHIESSKAGKTIYEQKLYNLIRSRTLATQMTPAKLEKTVVRITTPNTKHIFEAKGEVILFDGFLKVYGSSKETNLPPLTADESVKNREVIAKQSFKNPPARYTEGSLVKKLEELGIGRPSTYASILTAIQTRGYVIKGDSEGVDREFIILTLRSDIKRTVDTEKTGANKGKLVPTPVGELISDFLVQNFSDIMDYDFTADLEEQLDRIADADLTRVKLLSDFYGPFNKTVKKAGDVERFNGAIELGKDPETKKPIYSKVGRNGGFLQLGDSKKESGEDPRFAPLPNGKDTRTVTLEEAIEQFKLPQLPRSLGTAKDGVELIAANGPFGPYLKAGNYNVPLGKRDPYTITLPTAVKLYEEKLASIIADWGDIKILIGRYGPYVKGPGRFNNAKIPEGTDPKELTEADAKKILEEKPARGSAKKSTKKTATKKPRKTTKTRKARAR